jgi:hypothetical protein
MSIHKNTQKSRGRLYLINSCKIGWGDRTTVSLKAGQITGGLLLQARYQGKILDSEVAGDNLLKQKAFGRKLFCLGIVRDNIFFFQK